MKINKKSLICFLIFFVHRFFLAPDSDWGVRPRWLLSLDNLFVFHLIFKTYKTPAAQIHKALFIGIMGIQT